MTQAVTRMNVVARRILSATAEASSHAEAATRLAETTSPAGVERVVPLFAGTSVPADTPSKPRADETAWAAAIDLVRSTAARVRTLHERAHTVAHDAEQLAASATASTRAAEERTLRAEATTQAALARVARAEEQARGLLDKILVAEAQTGTADAKASEALVWLQRMHECVAGEFNSLTFGPVPVRTR